VSLLNTKMLDLSAFRILVLDDNANIRSIVKMILRAMGIKDVRDTADGRKALNYLETTNIDIIITDWMMDGMDGAEFVSRVRGHKIRSKSMTPIIMLSGFTETSRVARARNMGVTEFLAKPVSPVELYLRIVEIVRRPRQFVRTETFFGPDRHRKLIPDYAGPLRRDGDGGSDGDADRDTDRDTGQDEKDGVK